jgi:hypothetical protein
MEFHMRRKGQSFLVAHNSFNSFSGPSVGNCVLDPTRPKTVTYAK